MATNSNQLVQKLWNLCNVLRDDGVSTIEYVEQLTYLLFLNMALLTLLWVRLWERVFVRVGVGG
jgi:type I restriction-modification system DNA methylase subunit